MKILLGIQARTNSTRLPEKIFADLGGKKVIEWVVDACKKAAEIHKGNECLVAILAPEGDGKIEEWCKETGTPLVEGSETDLINRYMKAIEFFEADACVRITADCWGILPEIIAQVATQLEAADYSSNTMIRTMLEGFDCQGAKKQAWEWLDEHQQMEREHPWSWLDGNNLVKESFVEAGFKLSHVIDPNNPVVIKTSIDTEEDLKRAREYVAGKK